MSYECRITPERDVQYKFRINGKIMTFQFVGTRPNGRLLFENCAVKTLTSMLPNRFAWLCRFALLDKKKVLPVSEDEIAKREEIKKQLKKRLSNLKSIRDDVSQRLRDDMKRETGITFDMLHDDLSFALLSIENNPKLADNALQEYNFVIRYLQRYRSA